VQKRSRRQGVFRNVRILAADGCPDACQSHDGQADAEREAYIPEVLAGLLAGSDAPLGGEEPDTVREVPADGDHGDDVYGEHPGVLQLYLHLVECRIGMVRKVDAGEALPVYMLRDVGEGDEAGVALRDVHPIAGPGVVDDVGLAAKPDPNSVDAVIEDGQKDEDPFEYTNQGKAVEEFDLVAIGDGPFVHFEIRKKMLQQERADGDDAEQRVELAPEE